MLVVILALSTIVCAAGCFVNSVASYALVKYMKDKGYSLPTEEEINSCSAWALKKVLHIN